MPNINDLRRLALQRHKAATRKISRTKAANDVEVSGSQYDPRKSLEFIRSATSKQLQSYVNKLDRFNNRRTQFVPDAHFKPIRKELWSEYQQAEAKRNEAQDKNYGQFKDIVIEPIGATVDERMRQITPLHAHMGGLSSESPYRKRELSSTSVVSEKKLKDLIKLRKEQATAKHQNQVLKAHRQGAIDMATVIGDLELMEGLAALTDKQFALVWKYTRLPSHIKQDYEFYKDAIKGRKGVTNSEMAANELDAAKKYIEWGRNVKFAQESMKLDLSTPKLDLSTPRLKPKQPRSKKRK